MDKTGASIILLTYKGKILLMRQDNSPFPENAWGFIETIKDKNTSFEDSILKKIQLETSLKITTAQLLSLSVSDDIQIYFYHASLTDDNVNNIVRHEKQNVDFFTFLEMKKLRFTPVTNVFITKHKDFLEKVS